MVKLVCHSCSLTRHQLTIHNVCENSTCVWGRSRCCKCCASTRSAATSTSPKSTSAQLRRRQARTSAYPPRPPSDLPHAPSPFPHAPGSSPSLHHASLSTSPFTLPPLSLFHSSYTPHPLLSPRRYEKGKHVHSIAKRLAEVTHQPTKALFHQLIFPLYAQVLDSP